MKILKIINKNLIKLPTPSNISMNWNFGSMLGIFLMIQIITGIILSMHYCPNINYTFSSMINIMRNINYGWLIRLIHSNGASMFFILIYLHMARGLYYSSYKLKMTWIMGVMILLGSMMTAFLGYVLPWGQMSFWGATVITNLISTIPIMGNDIVKWIWGSFTVDNPTINRFFSLHFIMPFVIAGMVMSHLFFLHLTGSNNPMGLNSNMDKIYFHPYYTKKDIMGMMMISLIMLINLLIFPNLFSDPENFNQTNLLKTPIHIQPEWYFLFAYTILRSIPNKLGGVIMMISSIMILFFLPLTNKKMMSNNFYPINKIIFWLFIFNMMMLTWMGANPVKEPFIKMSKISSSIYFMFFPFNQWVYKKWDKLIFNYTKLY